jgi:hypothetical protein
MSDNTVRIDLELPSTEALALAQFVKRVTWTGCEPAPWMKLSAMKSARRSTKCSESTGRR